MDIVAKARIYGQSGDATGFMLWLDQQCLDPARGDACRRAYVDGELDRMALRRLAALATACEQHMDGDACDETIWALVKACRADATVGTVLAALVAK